MQKFLIPTISLVFYYGSTNWSLKLRKVQQVQNISERVFRIPKVLSKEVGSNRRRREHI
jgi:sensor domain CHASE-containing protein